MQYLLDTNICIYIANGKDERLLRRFELLEHGEAGMSIVTYMELAYGASKSQQKRLNSAIIEQLKEEIQVLPLDISAAEIYGTLRANLERQGRMIGAFDMVIAAHALALGLTLVTNNVREFGRVKGLRVENWAAQ